MARTNLPVSALTFNNGIAAPAGTAIDQANGMNVQVVTNTVPAAPDLNNIVLFVNNTFAGTKTVTVHAGVGGGVTPGPAFRSGLGDLVFTVGATAAAYIGPFEVARFAQLDGSLNIDFASGITGTITALVVPERF